MDRVNGNFRLFRWGELMNPVAEVENVTMCILGIVEQATDPRPQPVLGEEQGKGVEVALNRFCPDSFYGFTDGNAPVEADNVGTGAGGEFE